MSNLRSLYKQYGLLFRHTVKDLEERELPCRQFTYLEAFFTSTCQALVKPKSMLRPHTFAGVNTKFQQNDVLHLATAF